MRKALIVGIDHYDYLTPLSGCVNDAGAVRTVLERHSDDTVNFTTPQSLTASAPPDAVTRAELRAAVKQLFVDDAEIALFYFAGHGYVEETGGFMCASDSRSGDDGLSMSDLMSFANKSPARNKIIILDSCHSGSAGQSSDATGVSTLGEGTTILTASTATQYSFEEPGGGSGVFTNLLIDALNGAAANIQGDITPGSVYAHIDQSLGPWAQRPVFKTNVKRFVSLRRTDAPVSLTDLRSLARLFPTPDAVLPLDPSFEPERADDGPRDIPAPDPENTAVFRVLQDCARVNLVRPVGAPHMWHAAMQSAGCELTRLGQHYWRLVSQGLI